MFTQILPLAAKLLAIWWLAAFAVLSMERRVWRRDGSGFTETGIFWWRHLRLALWALPAILLVWPMFARLAPRGSAPVGWGDLAWAVAMLAWAPLLSQAAFIAATRFAPRAASSPTAPIPNRAPQGIMELRMASAFSALSMVFVAIGFETSQPPIAYAAAGVLLLIANRLCDVAQKGSGLVRRGGFAIAIHETPMASEIAALARLAKIKARPAVAVHLAYFKLKRPGSARDILAARVASAVGQFDVDRPILLAEAIRALPPGCLTARVSLRYAARSLAKDSNLAWTQPAVAFLVAMSVASLIVLSLVVSNSSGRYPGAGGWVVARYAVPAALLLGAMACAALWRVALRMGEGLEGQRMACRVWIAAAPEDRRDEAAYVRAQAQLDRFYLCHAFEPEPMVRAIARQSAALIAFFEEIGQERAMEAIRQGVADIAALEAFEEGVASRAANREVPPPPPPSAA